MTSLLLGGLAAGLLLGWLCNIIIIRLSREQGFVAWPPRCTRCGQPLKLWQILPLFGWLLQRGRGRCCGKPLHWIYPLVELLSMITMARLLTREGLSLTFFYLSFVAAILLITGAIDWLYRVIYTFPMLGSCVIVLLFALALPQQTILNAFLGLFLAGFIFLLFYLLARFLFPGHGAPFGLGDVYLGMFLGAAFGLTRMMPVIFYGMLLAGIFSLFVIILRSSGRSKHVYISYGTFLCLGGLAVIIWRGM